MSLLAVAASRYEFAYPQALWLLLLVPVALLLRGLMRRRLRSAVVFSSIDVAEQLHGGLRRLLRWVPMFLRAIALAAVVVALARPQYGHGQVRTSTNGVAIMMCVDRSGSMLEPFPFDGREVTKMDAVKTVFEQFIKGNDKDLKGRPADMIGLVTFARYADTVCPLVRIHDTLIKLMTNVQVAEPRPGNPEAGTSIGDGLALAAARLKDVESELQRRANLVKRKGAGFGGAKSAADEPDFTIKSKIIILLTDGEENTGDMVAAKAAELCKQWGIKVYAIGIGAGGRTTMRTAQGIIRLPGRGFDDRPLKNVANVTGGIYRPANDAEALRNISKEIDELEKTEIKSEEFTSYDEAFVPWAVLAAACVGLELLLSATLLRRAP